MQETTNPKYLTITEAAAILRVSPLSLANDVTRSSTIPPFLRKGRIILFPESLLHKWMLDRVVNLPSQDHAHSSSVSKNRAGRPRKQESVVQQ